jgi:hypothetical protein
MNLTEVLEELGDYKKRLDTVIEGLEAARRTPSARLIQRVTAQFGDGRSASGAFRLESRRQVALVRLARQVLETERQRGKSNAPVGESLAGAKVARFAPGIVQMQKPDKTRGSPAMRRAGGGGRERE